MQQQTEQTIEVLNELIEISADGEKGFAEAAHDAKETKLKSLFGQCSTECATAVKELQGLVQNLGGSAKSSGSATGAAHRLWVKVKAAFEDSDIAALEEVERGQDHAKAAYAKALKADLPVNVREIVQRQANGAIRNHDLIRNLRNEYKAAAA